MVDFDSFGFTFIAKPACFASISSCQLNLKRESYETLDIAHAKVDSCWQKQLEIVGWVLLNASGCQQESLDTVSYEKNYGFTSYLHVNPLFIQ